MSVRCEGANVVRNDDPQGRPTAGRQDPGDGQGRPAVREDLNVQERSQAEDVARGGSAARSST